MKKIISLLLIIFVLVGCTPANNDKDKIYSQFTDLHDQDHVFVEASYQEVVELLTSETGVVIFSFSTCPYCQSVVPILNESAKSQNNEKVLYFDIYEIRKYKTVEYNNLVEIISEQVDDLAFEEDGKTPRIIVPDVYFVKEGTIMAHHLATLKDENDQWIRNLDDEQKLELRAIYENYFQKIK